VPEDRSLEDYYRLGIDGVEVVNEAIRASDRVVTGARKAGRVLVGTIDFKFGPHMRALTLLPAALVLDPGGVPTAEGVVKALRAGDTRVLYTVRGAQRTAEEYTAAQLGLVAAVDGLRVLAATPLGRRAVWFAWLAGAALLWAVSSRDVREGSRRRLSPRGARILLVLAAAAELNLLWGLSWQVREMIVVPVPRLLAVAAVLAVPLLAASIVLGRAERER
jgi:hypothetical protein